ncbi:MAG: hypothetical protein LBH98_03510 [Chitinispirillales bacterium]|jgi:hypothetical protein|nr:hypothetical protein [Chitinispirillales bacterium]
MLEFQEEIQRKDLEMQTERQRVQAECQERMRLVGEKYETEMSVTDVD